MTQVLDAAEDIAEPGDNVGERKRRRNPPHPAWLTGALALVVGLAFVVVSVLWNDGRLFAPLDDVYIHLQYGKQLGSGHFFQWNTGDDISAGASSMLYAFLLGTAYAIGAHGTLFLAFAIAFNILCFAVSAALITLLGTRLVNRTAGIWAGVLVALSGPLAWGAASGMEVGLVMMLITGLLLTFCVEAPSARFRWTPPVAALLAIARPEGLIFATALTCAVLWTLWTRRRGIGLAVWSLLPLAAGAGQLLFYKIATGTTSANGVQSKSMLNDAPVLYLGEFADRAVNTLRSLGGIFLGLTSQDFVFPGALLVFAAGAGYLLLTRERRPLVFAIVGGLVCAVVSLSTLDSALVHELRYFQPFLPVFLLFVVIGVYGLTKLVRQSRVRRLALNGALTVALVFSVVALPTWGMRYAHFTAAIRDTDVSYGVWIKVNLPPEAVVAVKDVGAVTYFSDHYVVDLLGLGTNGLAKAANNGLGSMYEAVRHLPRRPDYFATYDTGPGPSMQPLRDAGILDHDAVGFFEVKTPQDLRGMTAVPFKTFGVYRADWSLADKTDRSPTPGELRDYLNVADLDSESAHGYEPVIAQSGIQPWTSVASEHDTVDGGRSIAGGERFTVRGLTPGRPMTLTGRTAMHGTVPEMDVFVDGRPAGLWTRQNVDGAAWGTYTFTVPAELITSPEAKIELRAPRPLLNPYPDYISYGYWATQ
ncbi:hypothetical protein HFP15_24150 [Amycolatopsis sp. K13G38]|uniref:4-amino-4-deoxy-L-arabinose transferase n=1 Tax=Amycolatopsis acididurans TaxID=2724524 RepID=A0ABX1JC72_9PSEU|nr:hypothetical protein [Amycolatopsis acididurans]NKQ55975.1 hypothetical protein [Amycolatopsis acididurans]